MTAVKAKKKGSPKKKASTRARRRARVRRETSETSVSLALDLDGVGRCSVDTAVPFFDHMLETLARHSLVDLSIEARGDTGVDDHHTVEDVGLALGQAIDEALGTRSGIVRFGHAEVPLDEALVAVTVDLGGRPFLVHDLRVRHHRVGEFEVDLVNDFMQALMSSARMNLHVNKRYGRNPHHIIEAAFKALAKALKEALALDPRVRGVPSTKGTLKA